ncbi:MAG: TonB-dependent receptor plug domain-containing protein [Puniceicoccaceae bacterium]
MRKLMSLMLLAPLCAFAQDSDDDLEELQGFTVTGSRIKQIDVQPLNPVISYDSEYIENSGARDLQDIIDELPQNQLGLTDREVFGFTPGAAGVNLRGAGVQYTLTLLNGRRAAAYGTGAGGQYGFVNTQSIPLAAIDRIEILTDGASAIYGADAVTGVVNYILKDNYEGLEVSANVTNTFDTDTMSKNIAAVVGNVSEKSSSMFIVSYSDRAALYAVDREFSESSDQSRRGGIDWPTLGFGFPPYSSPTTIEDLSTGLFYVSSPDNYNTQDLLTNRAMQDANGQKSFKQLREEFGTTITQPTDFMSLAPSYSRVSFYGTSDYQINDNIRAFGEAGFSRMEAFNVVHPVAFGSETDLFDSQGNYWTVSKWNPYNPLGVNRTDGGDPTDINVYNRNFVVGNRTADVTNDVLRIVAGIDGTIADDYTFNVSGLYMVDYGNQINGGGSLRSATLAALARTDGVEELMDPQTTWNIFGRFTGGPLGGDDYNDQVTQNLNAQTFNEFETKLYMANVDVAGPLVDLESGLIQFAAGAEIREEEWFDRADSASVNGDIIGRGGNDPSEAWRQVQSTYLEFSVPLYEIAEIQAAARYEKFSGSTGDNLSPKVAARVRPLDWLVFRTSYSEGFRAPSLQELFQGETVGFNDAGPDPLRGGEPVSSVRIREGGNPDLKPEESESVYLGVGFEPGGKLEGLYVNVDWFRIEIDNRIEDESLAEIVASNDSRVTRAPATPADQALGYPGRIVELNNFSRNKSKMMMQAVDLTIGYGFDHDTLGDFDFRFVGSYMYDRHTQDEAGDPWFENAGTYLEPEIRMNLDGTWRKGDWRANANVNYIGEYNQYYYHLFGFTSPDNWLGLANPLVKEFITLDLGVTYSGFWGLDITARIINVLDEEPPLSDGDQVGYDYLHSPYGRMYSFGVKKEF